MLDQIYQWTSWLEHFLPGAALDGHSNNGLWRHVFILKYFVVYTQVQEIM